MQNMYTGVFEAQVCMKHVINELKKKRTIKLRETERSTFRYGTTGIGIVNGIYEK